MLFGVPLKYRFYQHLIKIPIRTLQPMRVHFELFFYVSKVFLNFFRKLRLAICMSQSKWSGLIYNIKESYEKFDSMLKDIDEDYRTTLIDFSKYKLIIYAMSKLMEMETTEQNKVALYFFNNILIRN